MNTPNKHTHHVDNRTDGYGAIVRLDGATVYDSAEAHGGRGVFGEEWEAEEHAKAYAEALDEMPDAIARLRATREAAFVGEFLSLRVQMAEDSEAAARFKAEAKTALANRAARDARREELATAASSPRMRVEWLGADPRDVRLVAMPSAWDEPFVPEPVAPLQRDLPGVAWVSEETDGEVSRVVGYGPATVEISDGEIVINLGKGEHVIRVRGGEVTHRAGDASEAPRSTERPAKTGLVLVSSDAAPKPAKAERKTTKSAPVRPPAVGSRGIKEVVAVVGTLERGETLLGVAVLEAKAAKPRERVMLAVQNRAAHLDNGPLLIDLEALDEGRSTMGRPDLHAAAIVTLGADAPTAQIVTLVRECSDAQVLGDLLDRERERDDARDDVVDAIRARLAEIGDEAAAAAF